MQRMFTIKPVIIDIVNIIILSSELWMLKFLITKVKKCTFIDIVSRFVLHFKFIEKES